MGNHVAVVSENVWAWVKWFLLGWKYAPEPALAKMAWYKWFQEDCRSQCPPSPIYRTFWDNHEDIAPPLQLLSIYSSEDDLRSPVSIILTLDNVTCVRLVTVHVITSGHLPSLVNPPTSPTLSLRRKSEVSQVQVFLCDKSNKRNSVLQEQELLWCRRDKRKPWDQTKIPRCTRTRIVQDSLEHWQMCTNYGTGAEIAVDDVTHAETAVDDVTQVFSSLLFFKPGAEIAVDDVTHAETAVDDVTQVFSSLLFFKPGAEIAVDDVTHAETAVDDVTQVFSSLLFFKPGAEIAVDDVTHAETAVDDVTQVFSSLLFFKPGAEIAVDDVTHAETAVDDITQVFSSLLFFKPGCVYFLLANVYKLWNRC